jgi:hypothetical protein
MRPVLVTLVILIAITVCASPDGNDQTQRIEGIVVDIRAGDEFGEVDAFTIKAGAKQLVIHVDPQATYDFPLGHLNAHRAGAEPIRVEASLQGGKWVATDIGDA